MSLVTSIDDLSHYTSNIIAPDIRSTSNSISNRITDLYTKDITFQQDVTVNNDLTVSGDLTVDGTTTSINTDSYRTEILEIFDTASTANSTLLKINQTQSSGNIIEVLKGSDTVITVDNSGNMTTTDVTVRNLQVDGTFNCKSSGFRFGDHNLNGVEAVWNYGIAPWGDTTFFNYIGGGDTGGFSFKDKDSSGDDVGFANIYVKNLTANGNIDARTGMTIVNDTSDTGVNRGLRFWGTNNNWAMYMSTPGAEKTPSGGTAPEGHEFNSHAIRIISGNGATQGFMVENSYGSNNFSVRASDGLGYLRGGLTTDGNITVNGQLHIKETTGTVGNASTGTILLDHEDPGGASSIVFRSKLNRDSDCAYIRYQDGSSIGTSDELSMLTIGTENDDGSSMGDSIKIDANYKLYLNSGSGIIATSDLTATGGLVIAKDASNADDFFPEQRYPPRALTSVSYDISGEDYGNGLYETYASSTWNSETLYIYRPYYSEYSSILSSPSKYVNGNYVGTSDYIVRGYYGEWVKIKLPVAIKLTRYGFGANGSNYGHLPGQYKIYGSNDGVNWSVLVHKVSTITYPSSYIFEESVKTDATYKYFALVVNKLFGTGTRLNFVNFAIYGQEANKKFSVDASNGSGYFAGDLQVGGDITASGTFNGISKTILSAKFGVTQVSCSKYQTFFVTNNGYVFACGENDGGKLGDGTTIDKTIPVQVLTGEQLHPSGYLSNIVQVSSGNDSTLFLTNTGTVFSCGRNSYGNLGINNIDGYYYSTTPVQVLTGAQSHYSGYLSDIVQISCSIYHSLFLTKSGTVYAIGGNDFYQLGNNTQYSAFTPVQVLRGGQSHSSAYLSDIVQITTGWFASLFLTKDGTVFGCGRNYWGELGNGFINNVDNPSSFLKTPTQVLKGEQSHSSDYLSDIVQISCSVYSLFLTKNGTVFACGNNTSGELGNGSTVSTGTPVQVKIDDSNVLTNIVKLSTGTGNHSAFITTSGTVFTCGNSGYGKLGTGGGLSISYATQVLTGEQGDSSTYLQNITEISIGAEHTVYLSGDANSIVYGAGINNKGQLAILDENVENFTRSVPHVMNLNTVLTNSGKLITTGNVDIAGDLQVGGDITTTGGLVIAKDASNADDFFPEQRYPPRALTSVSDNISGQAYGNGLYVASASEGDDSNIYGAFYGTYHGKTVVYETTNGYYRYNTHYIVNGYYGTWIKLQLPVAIKLTKYGFNQFNTYTNVRAPGEYKIYGSNDKINWVELVHKTSTITYTGTKFEESVTTTGAYKYFALVVNKLFGTGTHADLLNFHNFAIYGQEVNKKFSVTENGYGYLACDLQVGGDITTTGGLVIAKDASNADDFLPEQRYPPRGLTSLSDTVSGQSYGNGLYVASASEGHSASYIYGAFYGTYHGLTAVYETTTGYYRYTTHYIVNGYYGTWIKLQLPVAIKLTKYRLGQIPSTDTEVRAPGQYKIYGSNDNINWVELVHKTSTITYTGRNFEESVTTTGTYKYFALVVNKLFGTGGNAYLLNFPNFAIYGQEVNKKFSVDASNGSGYFAGDISTAGIVHIHGGNPSNVANNHMANGSLTIGDHSIKYGNGSSWTTNSAGLMMECTGGTEIAVHDAGTRVISLISYQGGDNQVQIGRDMGGGWGRPDNIHLNSTTVTTAGNINLPNTIPSALSWGFSAIGRAAAGTQYSTSANAGDIVIRSDNSLLLQSGGLGYALKIDSNNDIYATGGVTTSFTGNHICKAKTEHLYDDKYIGYIVSSSKQYSSINSKYHKNNIKQNINKDKNDCLPYVELSSKENDKNAFGVVFKIENETDTERIQETGGINAISTKESYDRRIVVSGCGEGFVWVSDYNGNIEAGDFISSSPIPGIGMKQNDDLFHTFTVAKITMDCDFNPGYIPVKVLQSSNYDVEYITTSNIINSSNVQENELLTSNYEVEYISDTIDIINTSNVQENELLTSNYKVEYITTSNIINTSNVQENELLTSNYKVEYISDTIDIINTSNITIYLKDVNGEYLYENLLDSNGDVVYDFEYEMKYITLDGTIIDKEEYENSSNAYRMALVGSCYKCS